MNLSRVLYLILVIVSLSSCSKEQKKKEVVPTTTPKKVVEKAPNKPLKNGGLFLPDGFAAVVVADSIGPSRHIAVNDNGDIYVKLKITKGRKGNVALRDTTNDHKADIIQRFGDYPNDGRFATEMKIHNGYLYYSSELVVYRQKLVPGKLIPTGKPEVIVQDIYPIRWHNAKSLAFDDKGMLYVTFSAPTNACEDMNQTSVGPNDVIRGEYPCSQLKILAGIWRFDPNKKNQKQKDGELFATGIRSVVGMTWNPVDNNLYAVNHGRDYLHNRAPMFYSKYQSSILPAEEFMKIKKGDNFGWPYTYYDHHKNKRMIAPEYGGDGKKVAQGFTDPIMGLPAHWAPNDLMFYRGENFPEHYKNGAFIAFHGSTNRGPYPQAGYIVAFVPFKNGKPTGEWEVFADGFAGVDVIKHMRDAKFRPMGLAEGPDGSLYVVESKKGRIWRIDYKGNKADFSDKHLAKMEARKSLPHLKDPDPQKDLIRSK